MHQLLDSRAENGLLLMQAHLKKRFCYHLLLHAVSSNPWTDFRYKELPSIVSYDIRVSSYGITFSVHPRHLPRCSRGPGDRVKEFLIESVKWLRILKAQRLRRYVWKLARRAEVYLKQTARIASVLPAQHSPRNMIWCSVWLMPKCIMRFSCTCSRVYQVHTAYWL